MSKCKKKYVVVAILFVLCLIMVYVADDKQQKMFRNVNYAYSQMVKGNYSEAIEIFNTYLSAHSEKSIYWTLIEKVNGRESPYTFKNVQSALSECGG